MGLRLNKSEYDRITALIKKGLEANHEIECKIDKDINLFQFNNALQYAIQAFDGQVIQKPTSLDVSANSYRVSVENINDILSYCKTGTFPDSENISIIKKKRDGDSKVSLSEYDFSIKASVEEDVPQKEQSDMIKMVASSDSKHSRLKTRVSVVTNDGNFRFDFTVVKSSSSDIKDLASAVNKRNVHGYEIELEYIGKKLKTDQVTSKLLEYFTEILKAMDDLEFLMSKTESHSILSEYVSKIYKPREMIVMDNLKKNPKAYFAGPQPVTLEMQHLHKDARMSVHNNYTVTHKADGERHLMYVDNRGLVFIINTRLVVKNTGVQVVDNDAYKNSLFDVEYVDLKDEGKLLLIFDTYMINSSLTCNLKLVGPSSAATRLGHAKAFVAAKKKCMYSDLPRYNIVVKDFYESTGTDGIYGAIEKALRAQKSSTVPYKTDGLILTPANLSVGAQTENEEPKFPSKGGAWKNVFKWKPPHDNTVDFLIRVVVDANGVPKIESKLDGGKNVQYKTVELYCGKNIIKTHPMDFLTSKYVTSYDEVKFSVPHTFGNGIGDVGKAQIVINANGMMMCDGVEVQNESIVEMYFDTKDKEWKPVRVRQDKTEIYKRTRRIGGTANDYNTVISIWETILNPITEVLLTDKNAVIPAIDKLSTQENGYYIREGEDREESSLYPMRTFHNYWVKNKSLIGKFRGLKTLFDPACGEGGDLMKWIETGFTTVLGADLYEESIMNPTRGVYSRLHALRQSDKVKSYFKYAFLPLDGSKPYSKATFDGIEDAKVSRLAKVLWGYEKARHSDLDKLEGIAKDRFDVVSCQFAIHYFFKNSQSLNTFIDNVDSVLKDGGYFIGTCFDGFRVDEMFQERHVQENESIKGSKNNRDIWVIKKLYDGHFNNKDLGVKIGVNVESINTGGHLYDEYLVSFDKLVEELAKRNIRILNVEECRGLDLPASNGTFEDLFNSMVEYYSNKPNGSDIRIETALKMSDDEKKYSFLNRWFVFKKDTKVAKKKKETEPEPAQNVVEVKKPRRITKKQTVEEKKDDVVEEEVKVTRRKPSKPVADDEEKEEKASRRGATKPVEEGEEKQPKKTGRKPKTEEVSEDIKAEKPKRVVRKQDK